MKTIFSVVAATVIATAVQAGGNIAPIAPVTPEVIAPFTGAYVGAAMTANQTFVSGNADWFSTSAYNKTTYGVQGDIGYTFYNTGAWAMSVEGRGGLSLMGDNMLETSYIGAYLKPEFFVDDFSVYGLAGYGSVDYTQGDDFDGTQRYSYTTSVDGFTWGLGAGYNVTDQVQVFVDYVIQPVLEIDQFVNIDDDINTNIVSVGLNYKF